MKPSSTIKIAAVLAFTPVLVVLGWNGNRIRQEKMAQPPSTLEGSVVMYHSPQCGGCRTMMKIVKKLQSQGYPITTLNIIENSTLAHRADVRGVPTFVYSIDDQEQFRKTSMMSERVLNEFCRGFQMD